MTGELAAALAARRLDWIVPRWQGPAQVRALFTTRNGGASTGAAATFDVGVAQPSREELAGAVGRNRARLREMLPSDPVWLTQVHGRDVVSVDAANADALRASPPRADAAVTRAAGIALVVRTADCLPVLLADRAGTVVGVVHAGWRGLLAGVLEATIATMAVPAGEIVAWIGPAIGPSAFEVGADVRDAFRADDAGSTLLFATLRAGKWLADLPGLAQRRLSAAGVAHVARDGGCTFTQPERFFSYRRDRHGGRMALAAWLAPAGDARQ